MGGKECCIICTLKAEKDNHLVSPQTCESWQTLIEAAKIRCHDPIIDIAKYQVEKKVPKMYYHRKCRSTFTLKKDLETI